MLSIDGTTIRLTRGDTLEAKVKILVKDLGDQYVPGPGDVIRFALKSRYRDEEPLIIKTIPNDSLILRLESADTKKLKARKRPYVYDIELTTASGTVDTFIDRALFYVTEEVV
ncbi:MAG: hypothetical protein IJV14_15435 [Lachnospiraceae bacterium]|nr:hypothetical protein [Lachnospiraceae bacterium]